MAVQFESSLAAPGSTMVEMELWGDFQQQE
jgi:hypothetical protein